MGDQDIPANLAEPLGRARSIEPNFAVGSAVLDRIASATAPGRPLAAIGTLREIVMMLVDSASGGLKPAFRSGANPAHAVRKLTSTANGLRLTLMLEPTAPGLPVGLPSEYRVLGRLTGHAGGSRADLPGIGAGSVVASGPDGLRATTLDEHGFFELTLARGVHRLEITVAGTRVVVPQLGVGFVEGP